MIFDKDKLVKAGKMYELLSVKAVKAVKVILTLWQKIMILLKYS